MKQSIKLFLRNINTSVLQNTSFGMRTLVICFMAVLLKTTEATAEFSYQTILIALFKTFHFIDIDIEKIDKKITFSSFEP